MTGMRFLHALALILILAHTCDAAAWRLAKTLPTGVGPGSMAVTPDGKRLVVLNSDSADLTVFALPELAAAGTIPVARVPMAIAFPTADSALVACFRDDLVARVDLVKGEMTGQVKVSDGPRDIAMVAGRAVVAGYYSGSLDVLDPHKPALVGAVPLSLGLSRISAVPGQARALVLNSSSDRVHVVDVPAMSSVGVLVDKLGHGLWDAELDPARRRVAVTGWGSATLAILNAATGDSEGLVETGGAGATAVAWSPDGRFAWITHSESETVTKVDVAAGRVAGTVRVGRFPFSHLAVSPDGADVLVTNDNDGTVSVIDAARCAVTQVLKVGSIPRHIVFAGGRALITCCMSDHVAVLEKN
jgi:YVTN family beta-propeller protein